MLGIQGYLVVLEVILAVGQLTVVTPLTGEAGAQEALQAVRLHSLRETEGEMCVKLSAVRDTRLGELPVRTVRIIGSIKYIYIGVE